MPLAAAAPGRIIRLLAPRLAMDFFTAVAEPLPISIMAMTAPTPMTMPSVVSTAAWVAAQGPQARCEGSVALHCPPPDGGGAGRQAVAFHDQPVMDVDILRLAWAATCSSCVTRMTVMPSSLLSSWNIRRISSLVMRVEVAGRLVGEEQRRAG